MYWALDDIFIVKLAERDYGTVVIYFLKFATFNLEISLFKKKTLYIMYLSYRSTQIPL